MPFYEPGLDVLVGKNVREERLSFTTDLAAGASAKEVAARVLTDAGFVLERTDGKPGLLESLAGIRERRQWPDDVSFTDAADAASGLRALDIAVRSLQQGEMEAALVGAVDMAGDFRKIVTTGALSVRVVAGRARFLANARA